MRNAKVLLVKQLDEKLKNFTDVSKLAIPERGWIHAIRTALNMTMSQLGNKLHISRQGVKKIEESEVKGSISLNSLKDVAEALDMKLVYGLVPKGKSLEDYVHQKAEDLARHIVLRTNQNMILEDQGIGGEKIDDAVKDLAAEIKREMRRSMWE